MADFPNAQAFPHALVLFAAATLIAPTEAHAQKVVFESLRDGNSGRQEIYSVDGDGVPVNLSNSPLSSDYDPQWSPDGTKIVFNSTRADNDVEIFVMSADGSGVMRLTNSSGFDTQPRWSPDGSKIAFTCERPGQFGTNNEICTMNPDGSDNDRLTNSSFTEDSPVWSPDGAKILYRTSSFQGGNLLVMNADGSGQMPLTTNTGFSGAGQWSPDGSKVVFQSDTDGDNDIYVIDADGTDQTNLTPNSASFDVDPQWSPDGSKILFTSVRDGNFEIYVMNADGTNQVRLTNEINTDLQPQWSSNGAHILFEASRDKNVEIYIMNADGSQPMNLTNNAATDENFDPFGNFAAEQPPVISEGGIILANLAPKVSTISPLSIISVFGSGFTTEQILFPNLDANGDLDKILAAACLEMNGERLSIFAATPTQLNAQASAADVLGPATFVAISNCDTVAALRSAPLTVELERAVAPSVRQLSSNAEGVTVESATPAFFLYPPLGDGGLIAARFNGDNVAVAPNGMFTDQFGPSRPAKPGDIIVLYGTGWGATKAGLKAGELATGAATLLDDASPVVTFGGVVMDRDDIFYVGVTPQAAGLYQLAIRVPANAQPGDNQVVLSAYGKSTPVGPVVPVVTP